jgi:hypothetical protein
VAGFCTGAVLAPGAAGFTRGAAGFAAGGGRLMILLITVVLWMLVKIMSFGGGCT